MKILILAPKQENDRVRGHYLFRKEIGRQHDVVYYGPNYPNYNKKLRVREIIKLKYKNSKPDLIFTHNMTRAKVFKGMGQISDIPKVHYELDFIKPKLQDQYNEFYKKDKYDLIFTVTTGAYNEHLKYDFPDIKKIKILPFSVDTSIYKNLKLPREDMVFASYTCKKSKVKIFTKPLQYPNRINVRKILRENNIKVFHKMVLLDDYINWINRCKLALTSNNIYKSLSMKYTEFLACGTLLLADKPADLEYLGFEDKKHLIIYEDDLSDLADKVKYYLKHDSERERIVKQGMKFVRKNHSCEVRVKEMTKIIKDELGV